MDDDMRDRDYQALAGFRFELRRFLHFSEERAAASGLTTQRHQALLAIRAAPGATMRIGDLAERLQLRPHSASELVARLEKAGLVQRTAAGGDRREVRIGLTAEGADRLASLSAAHREELRRIKPLLAGLLARI